MIKGDLISRIWGTNLPSAFIDLSNKPSTAIINAVALHPNPDEFCRELALRALFDDSVMGSCIVYPNASAEISTVGRYGSPELIEAIECLKTEIEIATRQKHLESIRFAECGNGDFKAALVPTSPVASTAGVIIIFFRPQVMEISIDHETQVALAFACEMYCSQSWRSNAVGTLRSKRTSTDDFGVISLTSRQKKVLELMAEGRTNDRIARVLNYSVATVKNDISSIFQFLGVNNRHDAVVEAEKRELLPPPPRESIANSVGKKVRSYGRPSTYEHAS